MDGEYMEGSGPGDPADNLVTSQLAKFRKSLSLPKRQRAKSTGSTLTSVFKVRNKGRKSEEAEPKSQPDKRTEHPTIMERSFTVAPEHTSGPISSAFTLNEDLTLITAGEKEKGDDSFILRRRSESLKVVVGPPLSESRNSLRVGLCGMGYWGRLQLKMMTEIRLDIVSVFSRHRSTAWEASSILINNDGDQMDSEQGLPEIHTNIDSMLADDTADLFVIATPPQRHAYIAEQSMVRGKHVIICGVPCLHMADVAKLISVHRGDTLAIFNWGLRFHPAFIKMKQLISEDYCGTLQVLHAKIEMGSLIKSNGYSWVCDEALGGGALRGLGTQIIDILYYLTGLRARGARCSLQTFTPEMNMIRGFRKITSDDYCTLNLKFSDKVIATIVLNTKSSGFLQEVSVYGSKGRLEVVSTLDKNHGTMLVGHQGNETHTFFVEKPQDEMNPYVIGTQRMYGRLKRAFESKEEVSFASLVDVAATLSDGLYIQAVLTAARQSSRNSRGDETHVEYEGDEILASQNKLG